MPQGTCAILGIGPGNGAAFAKKFSSEGYNIALCSRNMEYLNELSASVSHSRPYAYDVRDKNAATEVFPKIAEELGPVDVLLYNAGAGAFANVETASAEDMEAAWEVNVRGLFLAAKAVLPAMQKKGSGSIVVTGATSALRGGANFAPFASAKAGQRSLAQSMARHLGPQGIHVSYVIVDGIIDLPRTRQAMPDKPETFFLNPDKIADSMYYLAHQDARAWTFELDLRPFAEKW